MSENTKPKKVILDVDTGSDDAVAIMTALQSLYHKNKVCDMKESR